MGYTTEFEGSFTIDPPLSAYDTERINRFTEERHDGPSYPNIWCDWTVRADGARVHWNGAEKSYSMREWLEFLIRRFIAPAGSVVNGTVRAQGEEPRDRWSLVVEDNRVTVVR